MTNSEVENAIVGTSYTLKHLIELLIKIGVQVHDSEGTDASREGLFNNLNLSIDELYKLQRPQKGLEQVPIPLDVLQYIEDGRNPDVYTREFVEATKKSNQYLRGKMLAMRDLRDTLGKKISAEFPELTEVVDDITKRTDG